MSSNRVISVFENESEVIFNLCNLIKTTADTAIILNSVFKIGLSGGSLVKYLEKGLPDITTDWSKWIVFFCDERVVPTDNPDSTFGAYKKALLGKVPLKEDQFVTINPNLNAQDAATDYIEQLKKHFQPDVFPRFDLLLLGVGPDGHTCSLFPDHKLLQEFDAWVAPITDSPKPPPSRITLTFPVINNASCCAFAISGSGKADIAKRILKDDENLPAGQVKPIHGKLYWMLDKAAASKL